MTSRIREDQPPSRVRPGLTTLWSERVEEILDGDHAVALAYATPAHGVVLAPVSNFGFNDRKAGIVTVNSSVGAWKKLERIRRNPQVTVVFHTRAHATHKRPEYLLVQGRASLQQPLDDYPTSILEHWERIEPWRDLGALWRRWLRIYALRVEIQIAVERVVVWPDLQCQGAPEIEGGALPAEGPPPQDRPAKGTASRVNQTSVARRAARLPNVLLGWIGADGFPFVIPVGVGAANERGIQLEPSSDLVPPGGRRAGLTAHWFSHGVVGQRQMICTGWMEVEPGDGAITYSPHTLARLRMPASRFIYQNCGRAVHPPALSRSAPPAYGLRFTLAERGTYSQSTPTGLTRREEPARIKLPGEALPTRRTVRPQPPGRWLSVRPRCCHAWHWSKGKPGVPREPALPPGQDPSRAEASHSTRPSGRSRPARSG